MSRCAPVQKGTDAIPSLPIYANNEHPLCSSAYPERGQNLNFPKVPSVMDGSRGRERNLPLLLHLEGRLSAWTWNDTRIPP